MNKSAKFLKGMLCSAVLLAFLTTSLFAQIVNLAEEAYLKPPKEIADIVIAPRHLNVTLSNLSPDKKHFLNTVGAGLPGIELYARPFVNLGESEFDHMANRSRNLTLRKNVAIEIIDYETGEKVTIEPPGNGWVSSPSWSPDGSKVAYFGHTDRETHIYVAETANGKTRQVTRRPVLATLVTSFEWAQDGEYILTVLVPDDRDPMPQESAVATEPKVRMTKEGNTSTRTYRFLLQTPYDMELLEYLATGQLALINVDNRRAQEIGEPDMYRSISISPDGMYLRATTTQRPFSYIVPMSSFGTLEALYNLEGEMLAEIQKNELREGGSGGGRRGDQNGDQKRNFTWRPDGSGASFLQMEPRPERGEEEEAEEPVESAERKDRLIQWLPPFGEDDMHVIFESENRMNSVRFSQDMQTLFITEESDGEEHLYAVDPDRPDVKKTIYKHDSDADEAMFKDPGSLMTREGDSGGNVVRVSSDTRYVYLSGTRYFEDPMQDAPRPFINKVDIETGDVVPVFESDPSVNERVIAVADDDFNTFFTSRESPTMIGDSYVRSGGGMRKLTENVDYSPEITAAKRMRFEVERADGVTFWVRLTLPPDYVEGTKLPAMFWFYPREYTDQDDYNESTYRYNKNSFPRVSTRSIEILTKLDYAIVQPDWPIIGDEGRMNDNYVHDLQLNAWAVIDALDKMEYIDRDRLGLGGHSYGAFGTANVMIHTPYFKAGIAGDGNYNRSLTPMGFQSERRNLWEARETYISMSPLFWADRMTGALLMYHGMDDANTGTFPINSDRLFQLLNGLDKDAALYMYPYEHHGPATAETQLDMWARWLEWLDKYVKNPEKAKAEKEEKKIGTR
ncbi:prolyl oligopeptidase family serine peptidase [candidate division KSB1 bacterium]